MNASKAPSLPLDNRPPTHWFFLRGLGRESGHWGDFLSEFEGKIHGARATALDLPGFGSRRSERSPASISGIVDELQLAFADARTAEPERIPFLFAVSLGGMVAADWLARAPEVFAGAVLLNSSFGAWSSAFQRLTPEAMARLAGIALAPGALARERRVLGMISNRPEIRERVAAEWARIEKERPLRIENFLRQLVAASQFQPREEPPAAPVLILCSLADRMVDSSCSLEISRRWRAPIRRHGSSGHDLPLDAPDWVIQQTSEWLNDHLTRGLSLSKASQG